MFGDERKEFRCNTIEFGCENVCFNVSQESVQNVLSIRHFADFVVNIAKANISPSVLGPSNYSHLDSIGGVFNHKPTHERKIVKMLAYEKI